MLSEAKCVFAFQIIWQIFLRRLEMKKYVKLYTILSHCALFNYSHSASFVLLVNLRICLICTIAKITFLCNVLYLWKLTKFEFSWVDHNALRYAKILGLRS